MVLEIGGLEELDFGVFLGDFVALAVDALDQDAGEQEVGEHDDTPEAEPHRAPEPGVDARLRDAAEARLGPAEAHPLPQHARDLGYVGVGVGVACAPADHHQERLVPLDAVRSGPLGGFDAVARSPQELRVDGQIAAVVDGDIRILGGEAVELPGQVVLDVAGGEKHAGHGQDASGSAVLEPLQPLADDRAGELQIAASDIAVRQELSQARRQRVELGDGIGVAAAVAADHDGGFIVHCHIILCRGEGSWIPRDFPA